MIDQLANRNPLQLPSLPLHYHGRLGRAGQRAKLPSSCDGDTTSLHPLAHLCTQRGHLQCEANSVGKE